MAQMEVARAVVSALRSLSWLEIRETHTHHQAMVATAPMGEGARAVVSSFPLLSRVHRADLTD